MLSADNKSPSIVEQISNKLQEFSNNTSNPSPDKERASKLLTALTNLTDEDKGNASKIVSLLEKAGQSEKKFGIFTTYTPGDQLKACLTDCNNIATALHVEVAVLRAAGLD